MRKQLKLLQSPSPMPVVGDQLRLLSSQFFGADKFPDDISDADDQSPAGSVGVDRNKGIFVKVD